MKIFAMQGRPKVIPTFIVLQYIKEGIKSSFILQAVPTVIYAASLEIPLSWLMLMVITHLLSRFVLAFATLSFANRVHNFFSYRPDMKWGWVESEYGLFFIYVISTETCINKSWGAHGLGAVSWVRESTGWSHTRVLPDVSPSSLWPPSSQGIFEKWGANAQYDTHPQSVPRLTLITWA